MFLLEKVLVFLTIFSSFGEEMFYFTHSTDVSHSVPCFLRGCTGMELNHRGVKPATRFIYIFLGIAVMYIAEVTGKGK